MPVFARIDWIGRQVSYGRRIHISLGHAADPGKLKIKIMLAAPIEGPSPHSVSEPILFMLSQIRAIITNGVATDRGHRYSDGRSEVAIWVRRAIHQLGINSLLPQPPPPNDQNDGRNVADGAVGTYEQLGISQPILENVVSFGAQSPNAGQQSAEVEMPSMPSGGAECYPTVNESAVPSISPTTTTEKMMSLSSLIDNRLQELVRMIVPIRQQLPKLPERCANDVNTFTQMHSSIISRYRGIRNDIQQLLSMKDGPEKDDAVGSFCDKFMAMEVNIQADAMQLNVQAVELNTMLQTASLSGLLPGTG